MPDLASSVPPSVASPSKGYSQRKAALMKVGITLNMLSHARAV